jgi:hypothetical protein
MATNSKYIEIIYPDLSITLTARLLEERNKDLCDLLWLNLPIESIQSHLMSSGQAMYLPHRIIALVKTNTDLLSTVPVGTIGMSTIDYKNLTIYYGKVTESLPVSPVGRIQEEDVENLKRVGSEVWRSNYYTHYPIKVIVRRKEL